MCPRPHERRRFVSADPSVEVSAFRIAADGSPLAARLAVQHETPRVRSDEPVRNRESHSTSEDAPQEDSLPRLRFRRHARTDLAGESMRTLQL